MIRFKTFLAEAKTSIDSKLLGHLTHVKDLPHELPGEGNQHAVDLLSEFHKHRMGEPSSVKGQLKVDGGASVVVGHDDQGTFVSDKHRHASGTIARTPEEVDKHFGHHPGYAAQLKNVLEHAHKFVNKGHTIQGDLMFTEHEKPHASGGKVSTMPNRIEYGMKTPAKIGIAAHTEITQGIAHAATPEATKPHKDVFVPQSDYKPDPKTYKPADRKAVEHHLEAAKSLMREHTTQHMTPAHEKLFTSYINKTVKEGTSPTVEGYKQHIGEQGKKEAKKLKTAAGQQKKLNEYAGHVDHVTKHEKHFERSINIRHHLAQATEHVLSGIHHPDMSTSIDKKPSAGEGIVVLKKDELGLDRPVGKLVPQHVSHAIRNNPRFEK